MTSTAKKEKIDVRQPFGTPGRCEDLSVCPALLLNLSGLRDSLCFKRLFIPGVCCPIDDDDEPGHFTTKR